MLPARSFLPAVMPSTGCAQEKILRCEPVHNGRKLSTLGISRVTLHVKRPDPRTAPRRGRACGHRAGPKRHPARAGGRRHGTAGSARVHAGRGEAPAAARGRTADWPERHRRMRAFAGRPGNRLSSIRACVRQRARSSTGSAGPSRNWLPARPEQKRREATLRLRPQLVVSLRRGLMQSGPIRAAPAWHRSPRGRTRPRRSRRVRTGLRDAAGRRRRMTSPGWPRSGRWSPMPIRNWPNACRATSPLPNKRPPGTGRWRCLGRGLRRRRRPRQGSRLPRGGA